MMMMMAAVCVCVCVRARASGLFNVAMSMVAARAWDGDAGVEDGEAVMRWCLCLCA